MATGRRGLFLCSLLTVYFGDRRILEGRSFVVVCGPWVDFGQRSLARAFLRSAYLE
jgi:hypothetical protein